MVRGGWNRRSRHFRRCLGVSRNRSGPVLTRQRSDQPLGCCGYAKPRRDDICVHRLCRGRRSLLDSAARPTARSRGGSSGDNGGHHACRRLLSARFASRGSTTRHSCQFCLRRARGLVVHRRVGLRTRWATRSCARFTCRRVHFGNSPTGQRPSRRQNRPLAASRTHPRRHVDRRNRRHDDTDGTVQSARGLAKVRAFGGGWRREEGHR